MNSHVQCLRCYHDIPVQPELVGQMIICPSCLERVYVSRASFETEKRNKATQSLPSAAPPPSFAADVLARVRPTAAGEGNSLFIAVIAIGAVATLLLLAIGLVVLRAPSIEEDKKVADTKPSTKAAPNEPRVIPQPTFPQVTNVDAARPVAPSGDVVRRWTIRTGPITPVPGIPYGQVESSSSRWPEFWHLPEPDSNAAEVLASLGDDAAPWRLSLNGMATNVPFPASLSVVPESESPRPLPPGVREPIAGLARDGSDLVFSWSSQGDRNLSQVFSNCLLEISDGKQKRVGQFRAPLRAEPIAIDVASEKQTFEFSLSNPPRQTALRLETTDLLGLPRDAKLRGGVNVVAAAPLASPGISYPSAPRAGLPPGQIPNTGFAPAFSAGGGMTGAAPLASPSQLIIEFEGISDFEIQVGFRANNGKVTVFVDPMFREGGKVAELSARRLSQIEEEARKVLPGAQRDLEGAERNLRHWTEKLSKSKGNEPLPSNRRFRAWQAEHSEATRNVATFERNVAELESRIEKSKARLEMVPKLRALMKDSDKRATIHYVVYAECGDVDLMLIDGRGQR